MEDGDYNDPYLDEIANVVTKYIKSEKWKNSNSIDIKDLLNKEKNIDTFEKISSINIESNVKLKLKRGRKKK